MSALIIGFGHKARNGKDEAIKAIIAANPDVHIKRYGFGDALKREVNAAAMAAGGMEKLLAQGGVPDDRYGQLSTCFVPFSSNVVFHPDAPTDDPLCPLGKQRTLLQWWGTEYRRAQDPNYWVQKTMEMIAQDAPDVALICDVRFPNEAEGIRAAGGYIVRVRRLGYVSDVPQHVSETALNGYGPMSWDAVIDVPDGQLELLKEDAVNTFEFIRELDFANRRVHAPV